MLTAEDIGVINATAGRRWGGGSAPFTATAVGRAAAAQRASDSPHVRAARLAADLLREHAGVAAALQSALLVLHCSLRLDGWVLLAPQGVTAGMVRALAGGDDPSSVARWLEDRTVPVASA
ncbi:MAG: hypothetical protein ACYDAC_01280 [Candidatus Dormibacteria bacterium]